MSDELLRELIAEVRGLRADLRRQARAAGTGDFEAALRDTFGEGEQVSVASLLSIADDDPHGRIADALAAVVDLGADGRAERLGLLLARLPCLELLDTRRRGAAVYRLRAEDS